MTFRGIRYSFECDSCRNSIEFQGNIDLENIPSIKSLAEHEFDEVQASRHSPAVRVKDGHICWECSLASHVYLSSDSITVADVLQLIDEGKNRDVED